MSKNLAAVEGTYSFELVKYLEQIFAKSKNPKVSLQDMKTYIEMIVVPAKLTKAKQTFLGRLKMKTTKYDVYWLCYNATTAGILYGC
jgi:hypothetical protein